MKGQVHFLREGRSDRDRQVGAGTFCRRLSLERSPQEQMGKGRDSEDLDAVPLQRDQQAEQRATHQGIKSVIGKMSNL